MSHGVVLLYSISQAMKYYYNKKQKMKTFISEKWWKSFRNFKYSDITTVTAAVKITKMNVYRMLMKKFKFQNLFLLFS